MRVISIYIIICDTFIKHKKMKFICFGIWIYYRIILIIMISDSFKTETSIKSFYGPYGWCGNNYGGERSGHYLGTKQKSNGVIMVHVDINVNDILFEQIDYIEIYNETGFLVQYMRDSLKKPHHHFFLSPHAEPGTRRARRRG